jgi:hypothetical protein
MASHYAKTTTKTKIFLVVEDIYVVSKFLTTSKE